MNFRRYRELKEKGKLSPAKHGGHVGVMTTQHDIDDGKEFPPIFEPLKLEDIRTMEKANRDAADELAALISDLEGLK